ncbi:MAG: 6-bladed beta-propeller [Flavobacteriaceae bacterium]|nr:6-bladed beta-propeller [Flavobacteriaceae bacterium]
MFVLVGQQVEMDSVKRTSAINKVEWVRSFPKATSTKFFRKGWFKRLVLGRSSHSLLKPMMALPLEKEGFLVLDQGSGTVFMLHQDKMKVPKAFRKFKGSFTSLVDACLLPDNSILFTESAHRKVYLLSADRKKMKVLSDSLKIGRPTGIAYAKETSRIWVVDTSNHQVLILNKKGDIIKTIGHRGVEEGTFNFPTAIWIDTAGMAYIVDALNYRIQIFDAQGDFVSMFGENGNGTGYFANPNSIATDSYGHIYVVDALSHSVQVFDNQGVYLSNFGGQGRGDGQLWMPSGIFIDAENRIYVADSYNGRIQEYQLNFRQ